MREDKREGEEVRAYLGWFDLCESAGAGCCASLLQGTEWR